MFCMSCGTKLPSAARFCSGCGSATGSAQPVTNQPDPVAEFDRLTASEKKIAELARTGPMSQDQMRKGSELLSEFMKFIDNSALRGTEYATPPESLRMCRDALAVINLVREMFAEGPGAKRLVKDSFPVYVEDGMSALLRQYRTQISGQVSSTFTANITDYRYRGLERGLDEEIFVAFMRHLRLYRLLPIKERYLEVVIDRIGLVAARRGMEATK